MTPETLNDLLVWLKATKYQPRFSRKLANFVAFRKAARVIHMIPKPDAPDYARDDRHKDWPSNRFSTTHTYLTDKEGDAMWVPSHNDRELSFSGVSLSTALSDGGSCRCTRCCMDPKHYDTIDITEEFWASYKQIGKCLFDYEHYAYGSSPWGRGSTPPSDEDRFTMLDEQTAQCRWCGDTLHLRRTLAVEIRTLGDWTHKPVHPTEKSFRCTRCHRRYPIADYRQSLKAYGPEKLQKLKNDSRPRVVRRPFTIQAEKVCPSCFLAATFADPDNRKALLPTAVSGKRFTRVSSS